MCPLVCLWKHKAILHTWLEYFTDYINGVSSNLPVMKETYGHSGVYKIVTGIMLNVCVCVCVCVCTCMCMHACMHTCKSTSIIYTPGMCICVFMCTYVCEFIHSQEFTFLNDINGISLHHSMNLPNPLPVRLSSDTMIHCIYLRPRGFSTCTSIHYSNLIRHRKFFVIMLYQSM